MGVDGVLVPLPVFKTERDLSWGLVGSIPTHSRQYH